MLERSMSDMNPMQRSPRPEEPTPVQGSDISLRDIASILHRRRRMIWITILSCIALSVVVSLVMHKTWRAEAQMVMIQRATTQMADQTYDPPTVDSISTQMGMMQTNEMTDRTIAWLKEDALLKGKPTTGIDHMFDDYGLDKYDGFNKVVTITNPLSTNLLSIQVDLRDREQAAAVANAIVQAFVQWKTELAQKDITNAETSLEYRVPRALKDLNDAETRVTEYKKAHGITDIPTEELNGLNTLKDRQEAVQGELSIVAADDAQLAGLSARLNSLRHSLQHNKGVRDDNLVATLQGQLTQAKLDLATAQQVYTSAYPGKLAPLEAHVADLQNQLNAAIGGTLNNDRPSLTSEASVEEMYKEAVVASQAAHANLNTAIQQQNQVKQSLADFPTTSQEFGTLAQDQALKQALYNSLQSELNAARLAKDKIAGNMEVTEPAVVPELPYKPFWPLNLALGLVGGILISILLVLLLDALDRRVYNIEDVRGLISGGSIIGLVPQLSKRQMRALRQGKGLPELSEAFNFARVNLSQAGRQGGARELSQRQTILVTSAMPGEGKSLAASQLALNMAQTGKSVILVDANMRHPGQNRLFKTDEQRGLAEVLTGEIPLEEGITSTDMERLSILHGGATTHNPTVLLSQPRFSAVMEALRYKADVVIVDAPDCSTVADTLLLMPYVDSIIQVVRLGWAEDESLYDASRALRSSGKPVTVLVNSISRAQQRAYKKRPRYAPLAALSNQTIMPSETEKTLVLNQTRDLVYANSPQAPAEQHHEAAAQEDVS